MRKDELEELLKGQDLFQTLDVKTLVLDMVKDMNQEELLAIFWEKLDTVSLEHVKDYLYMRRG